VLDYMQRTKQGSPELKMTAEKYVATGYQRLLTFETPGGGFSLMGNPPTIPFLTAYGLMEMYDMSKVYPVDPAVIDRAARWLLNNQEPDGSWQTGDYRAGEGTLGSTAYVVWALVEAGYEDTPQVGKGVSYIREFAMSEEDAYSLALAANALAAYDPDGAVTKQVLARLEGMKVQDGDNVYWKTAGSLMGGYGQSGAVETTALAAYAFMKGKAYPQSAQGALGYLVQSKDSWGTWSSTQATILSLKALLLSLEVGGQGAGGEATVRVVLNNELEETVRITEENADVVHLITFSKGIFPGRENKIALEVTGGGNLMYQVATSYYLPWEQVPPEPKGEEAINIDLSYDRTALAVNDTVNVNVKARLNKEGVARMVIIDLGVPPGFTVLADDLGLLVEKGLIKRYELTGRQIIIYLENFSSEAPLTFSYRLRARFPLRAKTPSSQAYDYYTPEGGAIRAPTEMVVSE
jgi:hypothetical protein